MLDGIAETDWADAQDMPGAQVAVADYAPADWPPNTRMRHPVASAFTPRAIGHLHERIEIVMSSFHHDRRSE
jgi:hypothetical protein